MPYKDINSLPATVRSKLDENKQKQFMAVFNSIYDKTKDEAKAMAGAYSAIKKGDSMDWQINVDIVKKDDEQQIAFGWLSVAINKNGDVIEDNQGDIIEPEELEKAAYDYMLYARGNGEMHEVLKVGRPVESMVFTKQKQKALGIPEGVLPVAWWIGYKVDNKETWSKIKSGELCEFSIGGSGVREKVNG